MVKWSVVRAVLLLFVLDLLTQKCPGQRFTGSRKRRSPVEEFHHHEVVTPVLYHSRQRRSTTDLGDGHVDSATVTVRAFRQNFTLQLVLNRDFISSNYIEKFFLEDGSPVIHSPKHHLHHCYYHGNLQGLPESRVAVSTCQGIRGVIWDHSETYYIEPRDGNIDGDHYVFRHSDMRHTNHTCGHDDSLSWKPHLPRDARLNVPQHTKRTRLKRSPHWPYDTHKETKVLELYLANDFRQYDAFDRELNQVIARTKEIVNVVNSLYRQLDIYVALVGLEIWTSGDQVEVANNADTTMNNFLAYRKKSISPSHRNDNAQLITGHEFRDNVVGKALKCTICSYQYSGGVNMDHSSLVGPVATTVAHEIGHNFGFQHDDHTCECPDDRCIMAMSSGQTNPVHWSSCSKEQLEDAFHQGLDYCLHNLPDQLYGEPTCGNGFLEDKEECDCGLPQDCDTHCCNASTCTLTVNATCATGACCDLNTCQYKPAATVCRASSGSCDLAEYCSGYQEHCPLDVYRQNGIECAGGLAYCYDGQCRTHKSQCGKLWGKSAAVAHQQCFAHFNLLGSASGNCGFNWVDSSFTKCRPEDVMCGMLFCVHRSEKLMFWKESLAYTLPEPWVVVNGTREECKAAILDVGLNMPDPGMTPDGAKCGDNKMCVKAKCTPIDSLDIPKPPNCNGHGVGNSIGQCHCDVGYAPPHCNKPGYGGSEHSGPVSMSNGNAGLIAGVIILLIILILAGLAIYLFCRHRETIKKLWNQRPRPYKYDFIHRSKKRKPAAPNVNAAPLPTKPAPQRPSAPPAPAPGVKRFSSIREMPISAPKLESSTNQTPQEKLTVAGPARVIQQRPLPDVPQGGMKPMPTRPPPRVPNQPPASPPVEPDEPPMYSRPQNLALSASKSPEAPARPPPTYKECFPHKPEYENEVPRRVKKPAQTPTSPPALPERPKHDSFTSHRQPAVLPANKTNNKPTSQARTKTTPGMTTGGKQPMQAKPQGAAPKRGNSTGNSVAQARRRFEQNSDDSNIIFQPRTHKPSVARKPSQSRNSSDC